MYEATSLTLLLTADNFEATSRAELYHYHSFHTIYKDQLPMALLNPETGRDVAELAYTTHGTEVRILKVDPQDLLPNHQNKHMSRMNIFSTSSI